MSQKSDWRLPLGLCAFVRVRMHVATGAFGGSRAVTCSSVIGFVVRLVISGRFFVLLRPLLAPFWGAPGVVCGLRGARLRLGGAFSLFLFQLLFVLFVFRVSLFRVWFFACFVAFHFSTKFPFRISVFDMHLRCETRMSIHFDFQISLFG